MAYYSNHNLAYDFALFEEERRAHAAPARGSRRAGDKPAASSGKRKVNSNAEKSAQNARKSDSVRESKVKRIRRRKSNFARIGVGVIFGLAAAVIIASIIHGQVQLTELNQEIIDARTELSEKQSIYTQLEMKVDSSVTTTAVEQYAKEVLHMSKATNSQKEFIALSAGDKAEVILQEDKNLFERIFDAIASLWS